LIVFVPNKPTKQVGQLIAGIDAVGPTLQVCGIRQMR
jgi:hypothetical protein